MNTTFSRILISVIGAAAICGIFFALYINSDHGSVGNRIASTFGGAMPEGIFHFFIYAVFIFAMLEIMRVKQELGQESLSLKMNLLPEKEQYVLSPDDVNEIKLKMLEVEKSNPSLLITLIKKACTKFRANKSISETLSLINSQTEINIRNVDRELNLIKYLGWAVQTLGLVGTVFGLSYALGFANEINTPGGVDKVTSYLGTAFNTTLVSVALSIVLMLRFTLLQRQAEKLHIDIEEYVMENLINRIYSR